MYLFIHFIYFILFYFISFFILLLLSLFFNYYYYCLFIIFYFFIFYFLNIIIIIIIILLYINIYILVLKTYSTHFIYCYTAVEQLTGVHYNISSAQCVSVVQSTRLTRVIQRFQQSTKWRLTDGYPLRLAPY